MQLHWRLAHNNGWKAHVSLEGMVADLRQLRMALLETSIVPNGARCFDVRADCGPFVQNGASSFGLSRKVPSSSVSVIIPRIEQAFPLL